MLLTADIPKPGSLNGPNLACIVLLDTFCRRSRIPDFKNKVLRSIAARIETKLGPDPEGSSIFKIEFSMVNEIHAAMITFVVRHFYQIESPATSLTRFIDSLHDWLLSSLIDSSTFDTLPESPSWKMMEESPRRKGKEKASDSHQSILDRVIAISRAILACVTEPLLESMKSFKTVRDLAFFFQEITDTQIGSSSQSRARYPFPEEMAGAWLTNTVNNNDLTIASSTMHRRSFLGVQTRRVRLRWIRLDFSEQEIALNALQEWTHLTSTAAVLLPYPSERLHEAQIRGQYARGEVDLEDRIEAFEEYSHAVWRGDWSKVRTSLSRFFDHAPHHAEQWVSISFLSSAERRH